MIGESLQRLFGRGGQRLAAARQHLRRSVVKHDSLDKMEFETYADDSPRFHRMAIEDAPPIDTSVEDIPEIDMTTATPEEFKAYQRAVREAEERKKNAPPYTGWSDLTRDVFYSYHSREQPDLTPEMTDPGVELHKRILPKMFATDDHAQTRNMTREDAVMSAMATMAAVGKLRESLGDELKEQARETQEYQEQLEKARESLGGLEQLREQARALHHQGKAIPQQLKEQIGEQVEAKQAAQSAAFQISQSPTPMSAAGAEAVAAAAAAGHEAAQAAGNIPGFGQGFGQGEPRYESPEQALSIAEEWANNPDLRRMAELFGRLDRDIRFQRSKRVVGGQDEIVSIEYGDNLNRVLPAEWALFSDPESEDDFLARYLSGELLTFSTVGEEHAGRGPIVVVTDGSGSMHGERNIWTRAIAMCLLHIARLEKRDFALVEFSGPGQVESWVFRAKDALDPEAIVEMCSHMFGGGTLPIGGVQRAIEIMKEAKEFRQADIVLVGDGEAGFSAEDERLCSQMTEMGIKRYGIGIGGSFAYLARYCEHVVPITDFELDSPSEATAALAVHVT